MGHSERVSTKTLYKLVKKGSIDAKKLRRKGNNNPKNHKETHGRINDCKTIHECDKQYPQAWTNQEYGQFEGDIIKKFVHADIMSILWETITITIWKRTDKI